MNQSNSLQVPGPFYCSILLTLLVLARRNEKPFLSYDARTIDALNDNASQFGIGTNLYMSGHNSKLTLEYQSLKYATNKAVNTLTLQAMIYL